MNLGVISESVTVSLTVPHAIFLGVVLLEQQNLLVSLYNEFPWLMKLTEVSSINEDWTLSSQRCSEWT